MDGSSFPAFLSPINRDQPPHPIPSAKDAAAAAAGHVGPGAKIGRYHLLEQIGEGGFGTVYLADQHYAVRRKVALKLIKHKQRSCAKCRDPNPHTQTSGVHRWASEAFQAGSPEQRVRQGRCARGPDAVTSMHHAKLRT